MGTSLKVLRHYACLWPKKKSSNFYIVNIQWTPKDKQAKLKINGYCDQVLKLVIEYLQPHFPKLKVNEYSIKSDPILKQAIKLTEEEQNTTNKFMLTDRLNKSKTESNEDLSNSNLLSNNETLNRVAVSNSWFTRSFKERKSSQKTTKTKRLA